MNELNRHAGIQPTMAGIGRILFLAESITLNGESVFYTVSNIKNDVKQRLKLTLCVSKIINIQSIYHLDHHTVLFGQVSTLVLSLANRIKSKTL